MLKQDLIRRDGVSAVWTLSDRIMVGTETQTQATAMQAEFIAPLVLIDDLPIVTKRIGKIWALADEPTPARIGKWRPAPGGVSIGHYAITAGTLGGRTPDGYILSNNHVLANSNNAQEGDPIYQPGPYDGGGPDDQLAVLFKFVPIEFYQDPDPDPECPLLDAYLKAGNFVAKLLKSTRRVWGYSTDIPWNYVDCALAEPLSPDDLREDILGVGIPTWPNNPQSEVGMPVKKSGRTTGLTLSTITAVEALVSVNYGGGRVAYFDKQIIFDNPNSTVLAGGDSGSLLLSAGNQVIGLCFAGSDTVAIANDIGYVQGALGYSI